MLQHLKIRPTLRTRQLSLIIKTYLQPQSSVATHPHLRSQSQTISKSNSTMSPKATTPKPAPAATKTNTAKPPPTDLPIHSFPTPSSFETFLSQNHTSLPGMYIKFAKKNSGIPSITASQAVEIALCYGWIDGRASSLNDQYWLVRYTPRRPKSLWSAKNVATVQRLINEGRMRDAGLAAVEAAKKDGRWERAYDGPANIGVPADLEEALEKHEEAKRAFEGLNRTEWYQVLHRLQTGAVSTRRERIEAVVDMLARRNTAMPRAKARASSAGARTFKIEKKQAVIKRKKGKKADVEIEALSSEGSTRQLRYRKTRQ
ncbi:YdeI/OmpD-associated family protein [Aspergillus foveolatus]|uniref:YdeI/OmpD-associated family protein n=1 Tax=Aspergillus foveolatus TaxID=210207 RepID=UPI003CCDED13